MEWISHEFGRNFNFKSRADEAPDLVYETQEGIVRVEVTAAYYDSHHAKFLWDGARNPEAELGGLVVGPNFTNTLASEILNRIEVKSKKDYGKGCILLISITPGATSYNDLNKLLAASEISGTPFSGIYVAGVFPHIDLDPNTGGYKVISIHDWDGSYAS